MMLLIAWYILLSLIVVSNCANTLPSGQVDIINLNLLLVRIKLSDDVSVDQYASEETLSQYAWGEENSILNIFAQSSYKTLNIPSDLGDIQTVSLSTTKSDYASDSGGCDFNLLGDHAVLSLEEVGYSTSSYDLISFYMPLSIPCDFAGGTSYIGEHRSWIRREGVSELAHQLGRSLGLHDASTDTDNDDLVDEDCDLCDNSCVMGDPSGAVTMNAVNRKRLGWIQSDSTAYRDFSYCINSYSCQQFVRIADLQQAPDVSVAQGAFTLIQLPRLNRQGTAVADSYYVSYRGGSAGQDINLESRYRNTVSLHHWSESNMSDSNTKLISSMREGETFVDVVSYKGGLMTAAIIYVESIADGSATVQVFVNNMLNLKECFDVTVMMRDSYGDGWQGNMLFIGDQVVSLADSSSGQVTVCLPYGEYSPYACGGRDPEEVSWVILQGGRVLVSNGKACSPTSYAFVVGIVSDVNPPPSTNVVTDPTTLMSVENIWLEGGYALVGGQDWVNVSSSISTFTVASVFMSLPTVLGRYANESSPAIARVRDVKVSEGRVTFETRLYQANDSFCSKQWHVPQPIAPMMLPWLIVQHGAYNVAGHYFMVGSVNITKTDNSLSDSNYPRINYYVGCEGNATSLCSYSAGSQVGIILQLQTVVNDRLLIPRCKVVALDFFRAGLQNYDSSDTSYYSISSPELLSYMSFPTGIQFHCYEKFVFESTHSMLSSVKQTFNFLKRNGDNFLRALYGTVTTATGNNLVAIRPVDQTLDSVNLLLQEDQCTKEETVHGSEEVALLSLVNVYDSYSDSKCMAVFNTGTFSPTSSPTLRPTLAPTVVPTAFPSYVRCKIYKTPVNAFVQNKRIGVSINSLTPCDCDAAHVLVDMRDSYGDGWNGNMMYLGSEIITLSKMSSSQWVGCLSPGSYAPYVCGGKHAEEISWSIFVNGVEVLGDGKADSSCIPFSGSFNVTLSPCVYGYTHVVVLMRDAPGDGWNGNRMFIGNETLTLAGGSSGEQEVCLPPGTYAPYVCEGVNDTDIEWDIVVDGKKVIEGGKADDSCSPSSDSFSVGCVSVTIYMTDSYGDGWNGNMLYIRSESFTLSNGFKGKETVCLPVGTYSPYVCGGNYEKEITWSITVKGVEVISNGKADDTCLPSSGSFKVYSNTLHMEVMTEAPTSSPTTSPTVVVPSKTVITLPPTREPLPPTNEPTASVVNLSKRSTALIDQTFTLVLMISSALFCLMGFGFYLLARRYMPNEEFKNWLDFNRWLDASKRCDDQQVFEDSEFLYEESPTHIFNEQNPQLTKESIEMRLKNANRLPQHRRSVQMISELKSLADLSDYSDSSYEKIDSMDLAW